MQRQQRVQRKKTDSPPDRLHQRSPDRASNINLIQTHAFGVQQKSSAATPATPAELWENYQRATKLTQHRANTTVSAPEQTRSSIQAKLSIGQPGDKYEQEADSVAERVMAMSEPAQVQREELPEEEEELQMKPLAETISPLVQRAELPEEEDELQMKPEDNVVQREELPEEEEEQLQMKSLDNSIQREELPEEEEELQMKEASTSSPPAATASLEDRLSSSKGSGSPLSDDVRSFMEPRFGADFSGVRVHTGSDAVQMNQDVSAQAFAHGSDIYFGAGKAPGKDTLTAHELTHVVQQTGGRQLSQSSLSLSLQQKCSTCEEKEPIQRSIDISSASISSIQRFDPLDYIPVVGKLWKVAKCTRNLKKLSDTLSECKAEYKEAGCDDDILSDGCQDFMDGAGFPSDSILKCAQKKNPEVYQDALKTCGKAAVSTYVK